jgi:hypothetical protein
LALELGGLRPESSLFKTLAERASIASDRTLVKRLLRDPYSSSSVILTETGARKRPGRQSSGSEQAIDGVEMPTSTLSQLDEATIREMDEAWGSGIPDPFAAKEASSKAVGGETARNAVIPDSVKTEQEVLRFLEEHLLSKRGLAHGQRPVLNVDRDWIKSRIEKDGDELLIDVKASGLLDRHLTGREIEDAIGRLRDRGLMTEAREKVYRKTASYLAAYERFGKTPQFEQAIRVYDLIGNIPNSSGSSIEAAARAYDALFDVAAFDAGGFGASLLKVRSITGDFAKEPISSALGMSRIDAMENAIRDLLRQGLGAHVSNSRALARIKEVREFFGSISKVDGLETVLTTSGRFVGQHSGNEYAHIMRVHLGDKAGNIAARTEARLQPLVTKLLDPRMTAKGLVDARQLAKRNTSIWTAELEEAFKLAIAYTRAVEVTLGRNIAFSSEKARWLSELYLKGLGLADNELPVVDQMIRSWLDGQPLRHISSFESALGLARRTSISEIRERANALVSAVESTKAQFSGTLGSDIELMVSRIRATEEALVFNEGPDFGFGKAWALFQIKLGTGDSFGVAKSLQELAAGDVSTLAVLDGLKKLRQSIILSVANGQVSPSSLATLAKGSELLRSRALVKFAHADGILSGSELEQVSKSLFEVTSKIRLAMSPMEAELFLIQQTKASLGFDISRSTIRDSQESAKLYNLLSSEKGKKVSDEQWVWIRNAFDTVFQSGSKVSSFEKMVMQFDETIPLTWEQVARLSSQDSEVFFHYVLGGSGVPDEGATVLRALLSRTPGSELEETVISRLAKSHFDELIDHRNLVDRNRSARLEAPPTSPTQLERQMNAFSDRLDWASSQSELDQTLQISVAYRRLIQAKSRGEQMFLEASSSQATEAAVPKLYQSKLLQPSPSPSTGPASRAPRDE